MTTPTSPDAVAFQSDLEAQPFCIGVALGHWRLLDSSWPHPVIAVAAAVRPEAPNEVALRFDAAGYPTVAPTSTPWDTEAGGPLPNERRPAGRRASSIFRRDGWNNGVGLYLPCDRLAMNGHDNWKTEFPHLWWQTDCDITFYLQQVYEVLHDEDYNGV